MAQAPNDNCANALPIGQGDTAFDTTGATTDGPAHPGHASCDYASDDQLNQDIWYDFTADCTGEVTVTTCELATWDTRIAVYAGCTCPVAAGDLIECNDDGDPEGCSLRSHLTFFANENECYKIRIGGYETATGAGTVNIDCDVPHEACLTAEGDCFEAHAQPGCNLATCCDAICDAQPYCCEVEWDQQCRDSALQNCGGLGACCNAQGICEDTVSEANCDGQWHQEETCDNINCTNTACLNADGGCFETHGTPGCTDAACCDMICDQQPFCCEVEWDQQCRDTALNECGGLGGCCNDQGVCEDSIPEAECTGQWYQETDCEDINCVNAACIEGDGDCWGIETNDTPACDNAECCDLICDDDAYCCEVEWDANCVEMAWSTCGGPPGRGACCVDGEDCQITTENECAGLWLEGIHCNMINNCENPISDYCPGAGLEPGDTIEGFTTGMTEDDDFETCGTGVDAPGVWYQVTGNGHTLVATTCNPATNYDTKLIVYCSTCDDPVCVGGNDDGSPSGESPDPACVVPEVTPDYNRASTVRFCSVVGGEYLILVQGFNGATGGFGLEIIDEGACDSGDPACLPPIGACCEGLTCVGDTAPNECNGAWYGGMSCATFECASGACCDGDTCIGTMPESECAYSWYTGEDCATFDCPSCEYCEPCYTDDEDDYITNVTFGSINRDSGQEGACSYYDATTMSTTVEPGGSYPIAVSFFSEGEWTECVKVYVDWNQDCVLAEDEATELGCAVETTLTGDIVVPANASAGCTLMRVFEEYNEYPEDGCNTEGETWGSAEDYTVCVGGTQPAQLVSSVPAADGSLWRSANNYATLAFSQDVDAPAAGALMIQELLDGGDFGPDLSGNFTFATVGNTLSITENGSALGHATWYAIRNTGGWANVEPFEVHLVVIVGDATGDGMALPNDLSLINSDIPNFSAPVDSRMDITGEGMVLPNDLSVANASIPTFTVAKPAGH